MSIYRDFLKSLDFSEKEMERILPDWEQACKSLGLTEDDVSFSMTEWLPKHWDLSLHGVRMCIGAYVRELVELSKLSEYKARGDIIIYSNMPSHPACVYANKISGGNRVHIMYPDFFITTVLKAFFNKTTIESDDKAGIMNSLCAHCGMNRVRVYAHMKNITVQPTAVWNWGLCCDEGPKTEEIIQSTESKDRNCVLTTVPHDVIFGVEEAKDEKRVSYLARVLRESQSQLSSFTGIKVSDADMKTAMNSYMEFVNKLNVLTEIIVSADVQPLSGNDMAIFSCFFHIVLSSGYKYINNALDELIAEIKVRVSNGEGPLGKDSPRLACHFIPFCVPWVCKAFQDNGINMSINTYFALPYTLLALGSDDDVFRMAARQWLCNPGAVNTGDEIRIVSDIISKIDVDGALYGFFSFDRWLGGLQKTMIRAVENETGIPHYYLEGDFWGEGRYSFEDRLTRIQNIAYTVKINHMMSGAGHAKK